MLRSSALPTMRLQMGAITSPYLLVRATLAEQLYRAQAVTQGHHDHRASRPVT
jgi:23S rRNA (pseudouridine1915-N3)-methyltransferase